MIEAISENARLIGKEMLLLLLLLLLGENKVMQMCAPLRSLILIFFLFFH